jgi:hypothetical protein
MGWWTQDEQGCSFAHRIEEVAGEGEMMWGDRPADIFDVAIDEIVKVFEAELERRPTKGELRAGLEFSLGGLTGEHVDTEAGAALDRLTGGGPE